MALAPSLFYAVCASRTTIVSGMLYVGESWANY